MVFPHIFPFLWFFVAEKSYKQDDKSHYSPKASLLQSLVKLNVAIYRSKLHMYERTYSLALV